MADTEEITESIDVYALLQQTKYYAASTDFLYQLAGIIIALFFGFILSRKTVRWCEQRKLELLEISWMKTFFQAMQSVIFPILTLLLLLLIYITSQELSSNSKTISIAINLTSAWIVIRFTAYFVKQPWLAKWIAIVAMIVATLNIVGLLDVVIQQLDSIGFYIGENHLSVFGVIKGTVLFSLFLWGAILLAGTAERKIRRIPEFTPSLQVLLTKITRIMLIAFAILIGLNTFGIDLTALAVFSGAVGVGLGFGLQKVVSNFISGIILLIDRSIKPGDVIVIDDTFGWVNALGARCVSVITRDGKEHLIPNELLITEKVENWSYSSDNVRIRFPIGISYGSDVRKAMELVLEAANEEKRALQDPEPQCRVVGFGDHSVNMELRVWISDPTNGIGNVRSDILLGIWDRFHDNNIEFPYPQRDLHIKSLPDGFAKNTEIA